MIYFHPKELETTIKNVFSLLILISVLILNLTCDDEGRVGGIKETFRNPPQIFSSNGVLNATLTIDFAKGQVDGQNFSSRMFNGTYTPPVLRVKPGDVLEINLINMMDQMYQDHTHGMNVTPISPGDDIFIMIMPTKAFDYIIPIPDDHPEGMFYYHSHTFGLGEFQVMSGLSGGLIVEGLLDPFPELHGIKEKIVYLKDVQIDPDGQVPMDIDSDAPTNRLVNGMINPTIFCRPGETQLWRVGNIGADIYYDLEVEGHTMFEIARDGNRHTMIVPRNHTFLPISSRTEFLVQCGPEGVYEFKTLKINMGPQGDMYPEETLLPLVVKGQPVEPIPLPTDFPPVENLCDQVPALERTARFSESPDGNTFFINGKQFDPKRVDFEITVGTIEQWRILNDSQENHVFHIHQTDFQVCEINGEPQEFSGHQDTVNLPFKNNVADPPTEVRIAINFKNPVICGNFVYHCHIMNHEDNGMMSRIRAGGPLCPDFPPPND
jgi:suppressor of ftsI